VYHLKSTDVSEVEILCGRRQEIIGHILERGHGGEIHRMRAWYRVGGRLR
jgi:hypothetical protein